MLSWWNFYFYISIFLSLIVAFLVVINAIKVLHIFQQSGYYANHLIKWYFNKKSKTTRNFGFFYFISLIILLISNIFVYEFGLHSSVFIVILTMVCALLLTMYFLQKESVVVKKKLVYTARIKRLIFSIISLTFLINFAILFLIYDTKIYIVSLLFSFNFLIWLIIIFSNYFNHVPEKIIGYYYILKAKLKLRKFKDLIVIGITGSYGKTSTKFILTEILKQRYNVLCTPHSYNTPFGITKTILNDLNSTHEIFVVEMGADHVNDIKKICKIIKPNYAIITSIAEQHLKTFKTLENIIKTKYQIVENLIEPKVAVFNTQNEIVSSLYEKTNTEKISVNVFGAGKNVNSYARNIIATNRGSEFFAFVNAEKFKLKTRLLGEHNIANILMAVALAHKLNVSTKKIKIAVENLKPVKHRLELITLPSGALLLDDSFNSNPKGSAEALRVLAQFENYYKIVITPGMVELGEESYIKNYEFGKQIAKVANEVYIVNDINKESISAGLNASLYDFKNVHYYKSFNDAFNKIKSKLTSSHIVLFENDLPDNYI